jgi:hypothetical protein
MDDLPRYERSCALTMRARRRRARRAPGHALRGGGLIAALAMIGLSAPTFARAAPKLTLRAAQTFVVFNQHARLTGTANTKNVTLLARRFGATRWATAAIETVHHGKFEFSPVPGLATRYEIIAGSTVVSGQTPIGQHSNVVRVFVHLDAGPVTCNLCHPGTPIGAQTLRLTQIVRMPLPSYPSIVADPVYVYVGVAPTGKVQTLRRVGTITPHGLGNGAMRLSASVPIDLPASRKFRFTLCDRTDEAKTGVGLPSVHDCGAPTLNRHQFKGYVG